MSGDMAVGKEANVFVTNEKAIGSMPPSETIGALNNAFFLFGQV